MSDSKGVANATDSAVRRKLAHSDTHKTALRGVPVDKASD
jgi:hypothetical protein